jgi:hypothetical protein
MQFLAGPSPRRPGFDPGSIHVGIVVDKVALGQVFPRVLRFSPVNLIPPMLHYKEERKHLMIFITRLHNKPLGCVASVASAAGLFTTKKTSELDEGEWLTTHPCLFSLGKTRYLLKRRLGGPQNQSGRFGEEKYRLPLPGFEPRTVQPVG